MEFRNIIGLLKRLSFNVTIKKDKVSGIRVVSLRQQWLYSKKDLTRPLNDRLTISIVHLKRKVSWPNKGFAQADQNTWLHLIELHVNFLSSIYYSLHVFLVLSFITYHP